MCVVRVVTPLGHNVDAMATPQRLYCTSRRLSHVRRLVGQLAGWSGRKWRDSHVDDTTARLGERAAHVGSGFHVDSTVFAEGPNKAGDFQRNSITTLPT